MNAKPNTTASKTPAAKAPAKKATTKAPAAKAPAKVATKAPAKAPSAKGTVKPDHKTTATKVGGPTHPGRTWELVLGELKISQSEAARQMGVAPMTLNRLINGHGIPTPKVCIEFARVTEQDVREVWSAVADYELALALHTATASK